jgi:choline monooxygenase
MKCNWKTYVDNYLEGYHLPSVHPGLNRNWITTLTRSSLMPATFGNSVRSAGAAGRRDATPLPGSGEDLTTDYFWIFPNWMLNCYPDNVSLNIVQPLSADRSLAIFEWYLPEKDLGSAAAKASVEFSDQIQMEDVGICETCKEICTREATSGGVTASSRRRECTPSTACMLE